MIADSNKDVIRMEVHGIDMHDANALRDLLSNNCEQFQVKENPNHRAGSELFTAAFVLGVLKVTPSLIRAITELILAIKKNKYCTVKITNTDGKSLEGAVTKERMNTLLDFVLGSEQDRRNCLK